MAKAKGVVNEVLVRAFKNVLKEEVQAEMRLQRSLTLFEMMEMAQQVERNVVVDRVREAKWLKGLRSFSNWSGSKPTQSYTRATNNTEATKATISVTITKNP